MSNPAIPSVDQIREHWNQQAREHGEASAATTPDGILRDMEIATILKYFDVSGGDVLDLGCGNGFSTLQFAAAHPGRYRGVDFSPAMIEMAKAAQAKTTLPATSALTFQVGDATNLEFPDATFDIVTTDRCLINLTGLDAQRKALGEIHRVLKPRSRYVMCENSQQSLARLNQFRALADLPAIGTRWHNVYLDEEAIAPALAALFEIETVDTFASLYYLASRIFNAKLAQTTGEQPDYNHPLNQLAAKLPSCGDIGPIKVWVLRKR